MSDKENGEEKPTRAQLEAAFPGRTFMDGGVSENQLAAAYPEVADAEGDGVSIPEDELKDLSADRPRTALPLSKQLMILLSMGYDPETAVGQASLLGDPLPDLSDWEAYYTNIDPSEYDGGPEQLTDDYRLRWGIETSYRLSKNKFFLKASTDMWEKRTFLFCLAVLYDNMWLASNSLIRIALTVHRGDRPTAGGRYGND